MSTKKHIRRASAVTPQKSETIIPCGGGWPTPAAADANMVSVLRPPLSATPRAPIPAWYGVWVGWGGVGVGRKTKETKKMVKTNRKQRDISKTHRETQQNEGNGTNRRKTKDKARG